VGRDFGEGRPLQGVPLSDWRNATYVLHDLHYANTFYFVQNVAANYFTHRKLYINDYNLFTIDKPLPTEHARIVATMFGLGGGSPVMLGDDYRYIDPERLRIALINLLVNARHAVNGSGGLQPDQDQLVSIATSVAGNRVRITVTDRGVGIDPKDLAQVFDPYFTTKRGGTGLGLPIAKNIVEGLSGTMTVTSTPGRGTEIQVAIPLDARTERRTEARSLVSSGAEV
jgi:signal transduction histidine kinase